MKMNYDAYVILQILTGNYGKSGNQGNLKYLKALCINEKQWSSDNCFYFLDRKLRRCFKTPFKISKRTNLIALEHDMSIRLIECEECSESEYKMLGF